MENQNNSLVLTEYAKDYLKESAKWSKFLSIIGFIGIGFMVLLGLFMGTILSSMPSEISRGQEIPSGFFTLIYFLIAGLYFLPIYYLYKYATDTKRAIETNNSELLEAGLEKLKSHHKFLGIMMLVILSIYALIFVIAIFAGFAAVASGIR